MKSTGAAIVFGTAVLLLTAVAGAQTPTPGYFMIYGNRDGSPIPVRLGQRIEIPLWGATPPEATDSIIFMHNPLSTDDAVIFSRLGGFFQDTLVGLWEDVSFHSPTPDTIPGRTNQSMIGFAYVLEPPDPHEFFYTTGDTVLICTFSLRISMDTTLLGDTLYPFGSGYDWVSGGGNWVNQNMLQYIVPSVSFSPIVISGTSCNYIPGDTNGDGVANGIDVVFGVNYFKGWPPPPRTCPMCPQRHPFYAAGDVNGNCSYNGIDITFFVNFLKSSVMPYLLFCPACPPAE